MNCSNEHRVLFQSHGIGLAQVVHAHKAGKISKMETNRHQIWVTERILVTKITLKIIVQIKLQEHGINKLLPLQFLLLKVIFTQ